MDKNDFITKLIELVGDKDSVKPLPELLTTQQAADLLKVSPETIRRMAKRGNIQGYKVGRVLRYRIDDLLKIIGGK